MGFLLLLAQIQKVSASIAGRNINHFYLPVPRQHLDPVNLLPGATLGFGRQHLGAGLPLALAIASCKVIGAATTGIAVTRTATARPAMASRRFTGRS
jgi:hypothetical protein